MQAAVLQVIRTRLILITGLLTTLAVTSSTLLTADEPKLTTIRIVLAGDSTVIDHGGWGGAFAKLLKPGAECINRARSGTSSKSFFDGGDWKKVLAEKPDFVLIQFGHNDQPGKGPDRETDPKTTYRENLIRYIEQTRQAKAQPILVTSVARRTFTREGKISTSLTPYADAMKAVAREQKVPVVDLHSRSIELLERIGPEAAKAFDFVDPKMPDKVDQTHLSPAGAAAMAPLVVEKLRVSVPELSDYLPARAKSDAVSP